MRLQISIASSTKKNVPTYNLTITLTPKSSSAPQKFEISRPFAAWFDAEGHFVPVPFQEMLATSVPAIGKLDARRVVKPGAVTTHEPAGEAEYNPDVLDAVLAASASASATGSAAGTEAAKKASKRRKA